MIVLQRRPVTDRGIIFMFHDLVLIPKATIWSDGNRSRKAEHYVLSYSQGWAKFAALQPALDFAKYVMKTDVRLETQAEFEENTLVKIVDIEDLLDRQMRLCESQGLTEEGRSQLSAFVLVEKDKEDPNARYAQSQKGKIRKLRYDAKQSKNANVFLAAKAWIERNPGKTFTDFLEEFGLEA